MLSAVLTTAPAASPTIAGGDGQQQRRETEGGHTEPLFFGTPQGSGLLARLPVEAAMLPTLAPVWGRLAELAVVVAKFVLAGRADTAGNLQGVA
eukprot:15456513-Alexandrium_andersonii.AAC.1